MAKVELGNLKVAREALCAAMNGLPNYSSLYTAQRVALSQMIQEIDVLRPIGPDGKHSDRHTLYCGCDDVTAGDLIREERRARLREKAKQSWRED